MTRTHQRLHWGARGLRSRRNVIWKRLQDEMFDRSGNLKTGFQIWTSHDLAGYESTNPLYQYEQARSALSRVSEYRNKQDLDDVAASIAVLPRRKRRKLVAELRFRAYRERHKHRFELPTKLTDVQRIAIVRRRSAGETCAALAKEYGVTPGYVWQLGAGLTSRRLVHNLISATYEPADQEPETP